MNEKAEKFNEVIKNMQEDVFEVEEMEDETKTVVYRSRMEVQGQLLPTVVVLDDSIYSIIRVFIGSRLVNDENRSRIHAYLNELNSKYKVFKYYEAPDGDIVLDACIPAATPFFDGEIIPAIIDVILKHLTETYSKLMSVVWSEEKPAEEE